LPVSIASIDSVSSGIAIVIVACLLIPREGAIDITINGVACVYGIEGLREVVAETPIVDILG